MLSRPHPILNIISAFFLITLLGANVVAEDLKEKVETDAKEEPQKEVEADSSSEQAIVNVDPNKIDTTKSLNIVYGSKPWNRSSKKVDTAFLFMKDDNSGKIVKILLEETEPDSAIFMGKFSVNWADSMGNVKPSVYIPPQNIRYNTSAVNAFMGKIAAGSVPRKPLVFKKSSQSGQLLDVFDTNDQASRSLKIHEKQLEAEKKFSNIERMNKALPSEATKEVVQMLERQAMLKKLATEAAARETTRLRNEQLARQEALAKQQQEKRLSKAKRAARKENAKKLAEEAIQLYYNGKFADAESLFKQAVELDPTNRTYYFFFGATLYRTEKFDEALVTFRLTPDGGKHSLEKHYFMGLCHYRLSEFSPAVEQFASVREKNQNPLSASAAFYEGLILYNIEEYEKAKMPFEYVIDNSSDPKLDEKAENYLEMIASQLIFKSAQSKRHILSATAGLMYDSNALYTPDNDTSGTATNNSGPRAMLTGDYEYRAVYTRDHEASGKVGAYYLYSFDDELARSDMSMSTISIPYTRKGAKDGKGYRWSVTPSYEILLMDPDETGSQNLILQSTVGSLDYTRIMSKTWFASYIFEYRADNSHLSLSSVDDNADATKYTLKTSHTFVDAGQRSKALTGHMALVMNDAEGINKSYMRIEVGSYYTAPTKDGQAAWNAGATAYQQQYGDMDDERKDFNISVTGGYSKPVNKSWLWGITGTYANNQSNDSSYQYSRYTLMASATWLWSK